MPALPASDLELKRTSQAHEFAVSIIIPANCNMCTLSHQHRATQNYVWGVTAYKTVWSDLILTFVCSDRQNLELTNSVGPMFDKLYSISTELNCISEIFTSVLYYWAVLAENLPPDAWLLPNLPFWFWVSDDDDTFVSFRNVDPESRCPRSDSQKKKRFWPVRSLIK